MKSYVIKVNGQYYAGEHGSTTSIPRPSAGWYTNRNDANAISFSENTQEAKVCEGLVNLNSHWQRIYNAMRFDGLHVHSIEIIDIGNLPQLKINAYVKRYGRTVPVSVIDFKNKKVEVDLSYGNGDTSEFEFNEVDLTLEEI